MAILKETEADDANINEDVKEAVPSPTAADAKRDMEIPDSVLPLIQKHDDLVRSITEEERRLVQIQSKGFKLHKKRKDLELLMRVVLHGGRIDKEMYHLMKPLIAEVDETIQQIVTDCLAPCIATELEQFHLEDSQ